MNKFAKRNITNVMLERISKRSAKVAALAAENSPEARKSRKAMNDVAYGKLTKTNVKGFFGKASPVKCTVKAKARHTTRAFKSIMRMG